MKSTHSVSEFVNSENSENTTENGLKQESAFNKDLGFELIDVKYANGYWFGAYGDNIGYGDGRNADTTWISDPNFTSFQERVEDLEADGYYLTDIEYTEEYTGYGYWFGVFDDKLVDSEIIVAETVDDFNSQVEDYKALYPNDSSRYHLVDLEYADGLSIGVLNRSYGNSTYVGSNDFVEFEAEVTYQQSLGLELTNLEYIDGVYVGIYSDTLTGAKYLFS